MAIKHYECYSVVVRISIVSGRPDLEWSPSGWTVASLAFLSLFVVPLPIVGGVYLYLRRKHVGLPR